MIEFGGGGRNRTGVHGFAGRCITTLPPRLRCAPAMRWPKLKLKGRALTCSPSNAGAGNESRTRDLNLGKESDPLRYNERRRDYTGCCSARLLAGSPHMRRGLATTTARIAEDSAAITSHSCVRIFLGQKNDAARQRRKVIFVGKKPR